MVSHDHGAKVMHSVQNKCSLWSGSLFGLCVCYMSAFRVMSDINGNENCKGAGRLRFPGADL